MRVFRPLAALIAVSGLFAIAPNPVRAEPPGAADPLQWRSIGPFRGGRVLAAVGVPGEPRHFYFGAVNGGVWETKDAGRTWQPRFDAQGIGSIGALAIAPSDPRVIYAGSGEADMRSDIAHGDGVYKSIDAGQNWTKIGLDDTRQIGRIIIDPTDADTVFVAALGHAYGPNEQRGVFRSRDGGKSWQRVLYRDDDTGAIDLAFQPGAPKVIFAALWQTRRPPWNVYPPSNGPGSGLYKSIDGGDNWQPVTGHGFPEAPGRIGLAFAPSQPQRLYAMVDAKEGGLYRSDDGGETWTRGSADTRIWQRGWYFSGITVEPNNPDVVYACNTALYRSDDAGASFAPIKGAPGGDDYHALWIDPAEPARRALAVDQGAVVSLNGGETWSSWFNQPTGQFYHVATDTRFPYRVYGAQQDSGAASVPSRGGGIDGINLTQFREVTAGGESDNIAPDPLDPDVIYGGRVERLDLKSGQTRNIDPTLAYPDHYRSVWTLPLVFSKRNPQVLYFANQRVFRTADGGRHWRPISPDLTREHPAEPATLDAPTRADSEVSGERRGVVYALAPSPLRERLLWAGTDDGLIWTSDDEGGHWRDVTPAALGAWSKVGVIEASHFDARVAYAAIDRHRLDDDRPYLYRTVDGGMSWQLTVDGIDATSFVNVVREDPLRRGLLYAGTEKGVYVSQDDGAHWQPLQAGLPVTSVRDLEVHDADLVIATHGRGFWVLDDMSALRQPGVGDVPQLIRPAAAVRVHPTGFTGSPMPKDEPMAADPAAGAVIDYRLALTASGPVSLTIYVAAGALVRRASSADPTPPSELATMQIAPEWVPSTLPLATQAGLHRWRWNLHHAADPALLARNPKADGILAAPGRYTVELRVDGQTFRQPLQVVADPRVKLPAAAYVQQFRLAQRIAADRARLAAAMTDAETRHKVLTERIAAGGDTQTLAEADRQLQGLADLESVKDSRSPLSGEPENLAGFRYLANALEQLAGAVDSADTAPGADTVRAAALLHSKLETALSAWRAFAALGAASADVAAAP